MRSKIPVKVANLSGASQYSYSIPDYWEDQEIKCRTCDTIFPFTATQQQDWYERQKKHLCVQPVLCPRCFRQHSARRRLKARMDYALVALRASPTTAAKLEAADTILQYFQSERHGDLPLALRLLRDLLRSNPNNGQALTLAYLAGTLKDASSPPLDP